MRWYKREREEGWVWGRGSKIAVKLQPVHHYTDGGVVQPRAHSALR